MRFIVRPLVWASLVVSSLLLAGCGSELDDQTADTISFKHQPLNGVTVRQFLSADQQLLIATSAGIYRKDGQQWKLLSSARWDVLDLERVGTSHYLAALELEGFAYLAESVNAGQSWQLIRSDFGQTEQNTETTLQEPALAEKIFALAYDSKNAVLYATGYGALAQSYDLGRHWQVVSGFYGAMARDQDALTVSQSGDKVWFGGQGAIENSLLQSFDTNSKESKIYPSMTDMLKEPGTVKNIRFVPGSEQQIIATGEPGMLISKDGGNSWNGLYLNQHSRFYFDLGIHPQRPNQFYTARWIKKYEEPQPFILELSKDSGKSWAEYTYPDPSIYGGAWSLYAEYGTDQVTLYFGLFKGGVMQVTITSSAR
ncbi:hypothetical protein [Rheinheimera sp.]|uniref:hypothetical protein n=1 Tax=Rheinheimera sp. TaxID=1869214 RepID=UPI0026116B5E|nr:hypothetical protein [Rheinheimera sp.]MCA1929565.1 hypothetical protein [Rheinheimera sp.]